MRQRLVLLALLLGLGELGDSFFISGWYFALAFAVLFFVGAWLVRRGGRAGPILVGLLCVFELASSPSWDRNGAGDWIFQIAFLAIAAVALVLSVAVQFRKLTLT